MSITTDPALYDSGFERIEGDRYFTEPWLTRILFRHLELADITGTVWEPACGRGDMVRELQDFGANVIASDVDLSEFDAGLCPWAQMNFVTGQTGDMHPDFNLLEVQAIITNPPYMNDLPEAFIRKALDYPDVDVVAMLLRSEFRNAGTRADLFDRSLYPFAYDIVVTTRPYWDWWKTPLVDPETGEAEKKSSPRHNFSWYVWDRRWQGASTTFWEKKDERRAHSLASGSKGRSGV